jgi:hypothetical protein
VLHRIGGNLHAAITITGEVAMSFSRSHALVARVLAAGVGVLLLASTAAAAGRRLHDPDLDLADAAIEKAEGLLQLTSCSSADEKGTRDCEKAVAKALDDLADARDQIAAAAAAADGGHSSR